ncbi:hypothetical protein ACS249_14780, partial [Dickeya chrysanthemi]|uniref:hypothetical protein n=1 Tax=Dickeya chrysanthemi TaxID=556 RepID=UPI003F23BDC8
NLLFISLTEYMPNNGWAIFVSLMIAGGRQRDEALSVKHCPAGDIVSKQSRACEKGLASG